MKAILAAIAVICFLPFAHAALVQGTAYDWLTLEEGQNIVFTINTTPEQTVVAQNGSYAFNLSNGTYSLMAEKLENGKRMLIAIQNFTIKSDGQYRVDLLLVPPEYYGLLEEDAIDVETGLDGKKDQAPSENQMMILGVIAALAVFLVLYWIWRMQNAKKASKGSVRPIQKEKTEQFTERKQTHIAKKPSKPKPLPQPENVKALSAELAEVVNIIRKEGGRINQKDLRAKLPHSEAKTSLLVAELEHEGVVKKFKRGRGNIIVLK